MTRENREMLELYNSQTAFRDYVDRYCQKHKLRVPEALEHKLVQEAGEQYRQMDKALK